jgi:hypothetical protein
MIKWRYVVNRNSHPPTVLPPSCGAEGNLLDSLIMRGNALCSKKGDAGWWSNGNFEKNSSDNIDFTSRTLYAVWSWRADLACQCPRTVILFLLQVFAKIFLTSFETPSHEWQKKEAPSSFESLEHATLVRFPQKCLSLNRISSMSLRFIATKL